jgi:CheY-like chemotaxis protein
MCNILIVDDHDDVREAVSEALSQSGHQVGSATNGDEALSWLSANAETPPCLIILDLRMPGMDGWDFLDTFRSDPAWADLPVIVLSALIKKGALRPLLKAQAFWSKPIEAGQLELVHEHCPKHSKSWPPPPSISSQA